MDLPKAHDTTSEVSANNKATPLEVVYSTKNGSMCTLKYDIIPPKFY